MKKYVREPLEHGATIVHAAISLGITERDFQNIDGVSSVYHEQNDSYDRFTIFLSPRVESEDEPAIIADIELICKGGK